MKEIRLLGVALVLLLIGGYASWTKEETKVTEKKATILQASPDELESMVFVTKTQTVTVSRRDLGKGERFTWFTVKTKTRTRGFTGNEKSDKLWESFGPFEAKRSLGRNLTDKELEQAKLKAPKRKLVLKLKKGERVFQVGGRTYGSRNHYVRPVVGGEVFLVGSKVLSDLEYPEGKFMQRKLRRVDLKDVSAVLVRAGEQKRKFLQQNRLSKKDAFWAPEDAPEVKSETAQNYFHKVDTLSVRKYASEDHKLEGGSEVLEIEWFDEDDKLKEKMKLYRIEPTEKKKKATYYAEADAMGVRGEVTRSVAEQLEQDLAVILTDTDPPEPNKSEEKALKPIKSEEKPENAKP